MMDAIRSARVPASAMDLAIGQTPAAGKAKVLIYRQTATADSTLTLPFPDP